MTNEITINDKARLALRDLTIKDWAQVVVAGLLVAGTLAVMSAFAAQFGFSPDSIFYGCGMQAGVLRMKIPMIIAAGLFGSSLFLASTIQERWPGYLASVCFVLCMMAFPFYGATLGTIPIEACVAAAQASDAGN